MRLLRHTTALMAGLLLSGVALAQQNSHSPYQEQVENPGIYAMVGDLVIARPLLLGVTAIGAAAFVLKRVRNWCCAPVLKPLCVAWVVPRAVTAVASRMKASNQVFYCHEFRPLIVTRVACSLFAE